MPSGAECDVTLGREGLVYKKGKFSATEDAQLAAAVEQYRVVSICGSGTAIRRLTRVCCRRRT